jgi:hypothetical protein
MKRRKKKSPFADGIKLKGFCHLQILQNGEVVGDSGWKQNLITDNGYLHYLCGLLGNSNVSKQVSRACLGSGSTPAAADTALAGEYPTAGPYSRTTLTYAPINTKTARFTFTFGSAQGHIAASTTLGNVGLINSTASAGSIMCGVGFATSQWNTNQDIQATYEIRFA